MATRRTHKGSIELRAYAGVDPDTGRQRYLHATVDPTAGPRAVDRAKRDLQARADAQATEWRRVRKEGLTPRQRAEQAIADAEGVTFAHAAEAWWADHRDQLQPGGQTTPRIILDAWILPTLGAVELWRLRAAVAPFEAARCPELVSLKDFYRTLTAGAGRRRPLDAASLARTHGVVRQVLGHAQHHGWIATNPAREVRPVPTRRRVRPLPSDEAMRSLLDLLAGRHPALGCVALLVMSGMRPNEVLALRIGSVDLDARVALAGHEGVVTVRGADGRDRGQVVEGDTEKRRLRRFRLSAAAVGAVRGQLERMGRYAALTEVTPAADAFLFSPAPDGSDHYEPKWASKAFTRWAARARRQAVDLPAGMALYDCRHYAITRMLAAGHPVADVADQFATSPRMIYQGYAHALPEGGEAMADTLDQLLG